MLFLVSVGGVCATDTDTNTTDYCLSDVNCSNTLTNNLNSNNVIDNDIDCCGAIAFQSVLKENGINITLEESNKAIHSVNGSTSMQGLIDGAEKYNLSAVGAVIKAEDLKTGYIIHMNIDNTGHWAVIENITNQVNLNDISDDVILPLDDLKQYYTNKTVIISKKPINDLNASILDNSECEKIIGNRIHKKRVGYKTEKRFGFKQKKGYHLSPRITPRGAIFSQWEYKYGPYYTLGHYKSKKPVYRYYNIADERLTSAKIHKRHY